MTGLFAEDGCVIPTIRTQEYTVTFEAKCEHVKIRRAEITIRAETTDAAREYAEDWLRLGSLRGQTVITGVEEIR